MQESTHRPPKELKMLIDTPKTDNVISSGDPLEIFTEKDGEVIFKKYSPMGDLSEVAAQLCESVHRSTGSTVAVCDRDSVIASAGSGRREMADRRISPALEKLMEERRAVRPEGTLPVCEGDCRLTVSAAAPILTEGDVLGCMVFVTQAGSPPASELELKLAQTMSSFLGRQMES